MISKPIAYSPADYGKVVVLYGGKSAEREVSLASGAAVIKALKSFGIDVYGFDTAHENIAHLYKHKFDLAFIALHGRGGEDGSIQGLCESIELDYTGSGITGSALSIDKVLSKGIWLSKDIQTAPYSVVNKSTYLRKHCDAILQTTSAQVMIKPSLEGSSLGMSKAQDAEQLDQAIQKAFEYDDTVLVEAFITGKEYTVGILGDSALPSISMRPASGFYDYQAKYLSKDTEYFCPSGLSEAEEKALQALALKAFKALNCRGWGRVDAMQDNKGNFWLLENNTVPGMTNTSLIPKAAKQAGLSFTDLVLLILQHASSKLS